ncbi:hypothetical protein VaNZ11_005207 [Volvox africanus]|uniref:protein-S-isoprenylcysteine alpha-carbonyl methylesterase n=1 Tax=Volvox africanus TaxID=51714 RepID=A0ABQ5RZ59_9CHLO|nr:hypothetical protein VaNZ11_005207 [Volvox africanus]
MMGIRSISRALCSNFDRTTLDLRSDDFTPSKYQAEMQIQPKMQLSDSSMFDLTVPMNHATSLVRRVLSEVLLLILLAVRLWTYLGVGWKWSIQLLRLVMYATLLMPGFLQMVVFYVFSKRVRRSVVYGHKPRQRLDLYFPPQNGRHVAYPVVIYVTGGAWTIGYKAWGALLARRLSEQGVLVACLDYRNFPQGDALDMLEDVNTGIRWVLEEIHRFKGDPDNVTLVGQSAGGHLAGLALIKQAEQAAQGSLSLGASPVWSPTCLKAFVGVSGAYDLAALAEHLHRRGLYKNLFDRIMSLSIDTSDPSVRGGAITIGCNGTPCSDGHSKGGCQVRRCENCAGCKGSEEDCGREGIGAAATANQSGSSASHDASGCKGGARPAYDALSPLQAAKRLPPGAAAMLPDVLLIHGTADKTVPAEGSVELSKALQSAGAPRCRYLLVPGKTHTAFLLEDPMRGGRDLLMDTVLGAVTGGGDLENHVYGTLCPGFLCDLAGWVCPF